MEARRKKKSCIYPDFQFLRVLSTASFGFRVFTFLRMVLWWSLLMLLLLFSISEYCSRYVSVTSCYHLAFVHLFFHFWTLPILKSIIFPHHALLTLICIFHCSVAKFYEAKRQRTHRLLTGLPSWLGHVQTFSDDYCLPYYVRTMV